MKLFFQPAACALLTYSHLGAATARDPVRVLVVAGLDSAEAAGPLARRFAPLHTGHLVSSLRRGLRREHQSAVLEKRRKTASIRKIYSKTSYCYLIPASRRASFSKTKLEILSIAYNFFCSPLCKENCYKKLHQSLAAEFLPDTPGKASPGTC